MELSPDDSERLKKVAVAAVALVAGGAIVKYIWEQDRTKGYVYDLRESGSALIGLVGEIAERPIQFSGKVIRDRGKVSRFEPDDVSFDPGQIPEFERVFIDLPRNKG